MTHTAFYVVLDILFYVKYTHLLKTTVNLRRL